MGGGKKGEETLGNILEISTTQVVKVESNGPLLEDGKWKIGLKRIWQQLSSVA